MSRLMYALPAWGGFVSVEQANSSLSWRLYTGLALCKVYVHRLYTGPYTFILHSDVICQMFTKMHYFTQSPTGEGDTPSPDSSPLGAYGASIPRLRRGLDAFGVEFSAPSAPRRRPPHYFFLNSTTA